MYSKLYIELKLLERKLDDSEIIWEDRAKLNRQRRRLIRKLSGRDPMYFIGHRRGAIPPHKREAYRTKKVVVNLLNLLEVKNGKG